LAPKANPLDSLLGKRDGGDSTGQGSASKKDDLFGDFSGPSSKNSKAPTTSSSMSSLVGDFGVLPSRTSSTPARPAASSSAALAPASQFPGRAPSAPAEPEFSFVEAPAATPKAPSVNIDDFMKKTMGDVSKQGQTAKPSKMDFGVDDKKPMNRLAPRQVHYESKTTVNWSALSEDAFAEVRVKQEEAALPTLSAPAPVVPQTPFGVPATFDSFNQAQPPVQSNIPSYHQQPQQQQQFQGAYGQFPQQQQQQQQQQSFAQPQQNFPAQSTQQFGAMSTKGAPSEFGDFGDFGSFTAGNGDTGFSDFQQSAPAAQPSQPTQPAAAFSFPSSSASLPSFSAPSSFGTPTPAPAPQPQTRDPATSFFNPLAVNPTPAPATPVVPPVVSSPAVRDFTPSFMVDLSIGGPSSSTFTPAFMSELSSPSDDGMGSAITRTANSMSITAASTTANPAAAPAPTMDFDDFGDFLAPAPAPVAAPVATQPVPAGKQTNPLESSTPINKAGAMAAFHLEIPSPQISHKVPPVDKYSFFADLRQDNTQDDTSAFSSFTTQPAESQAPPPLFATVPTGAAVVAAPAPVPAPHDDFGGFGDFGAPVVAPLPASGAHDDFGGFGDFGAPVAAPPAAASAPFVTPAFSSESAVDNDFFGSFDAAPVIAQSQTGFAAGSAADYSFSATAAAAPMQDDDFGNYISRSYTAPAPAPVPAPVAVSTPAPTPIAAAPQSNDHSFAILDDSSAFGGQIPPISGQFSTAATSAPQPTGDFGTFGGFGDFGSMGNSSVVAQNDANMGSAVTGGDDMFGDFSAPAAVNPVSVAQPSPIHPVNSGDHFGHLDTSTSFAFNSGADVFGDFTATTSDAAPHFEPPPHDHAGAFIAGQDDDIFGLSSSAGSAFSFPATTTVPPTSAPAAWKSAPEEPHVSAVRLTLAQLYSKLIEREFFREALECKDLQKVEGDLELQRFHLKEAQQSGKASDTQRFQQAIASLEARLSGGARKKCEALLEDPASQPVTIKSLAKELEKRGGDKKVVDLFVCGLGTS